MLAQIGFRAGAGIFADIHPEQSVIKHVINAEDVVKLASPRILVQFL